MYLRASLGHFFVCIILYTYSGCLSARLESGIVSSTGCRLTFACPGYYVAYIQRYKSELKVLVYSSIFIYASRFYRNVSRTGITKSKRSRGLTVFPGAPPPPRLHDSRSRALNSLAHGSVELLWAVEGTTCCSHKQQNKPDGKIICTY